VHKQGANQLKRTNRKENNVTDQRQDPLSSSSQPERQDMFETPRSILNPDFSAVFTPIPTIPIPRAVNKSISPQSVDTEKIHKMVLDCIEKGMYSSATFFADKLATIRKNEPESILLLARCYFLSKQYRRAVHLLRLHDLLQPERSAQYRYLGALCLVECKEWEESLTVLGDEIESDKLTPDAESEPHLDSAMCLLRGKVYEALENRPKAKDWYMAALRCDVTCFEALENLAEKRMLNYNDEHKFLNELQFPADLQWLKLIYESKLQFTPGRSFSGSFSFVLTFLLFCSVNVANALGPSGLASNLDLMAGVAEHHYYRNEFRQAYSASKSIIDQDPFHHSVLPVYLCCLVELEMKSELFLTAHQLVDAYPTKAIAWFSVACYYYLIRKFDLARRYFSKCTNIDHQFAPAWFGFGNAFAAQEEGDQAMAAYRTGARLFEGQLFL